MCIFIINTKWSQLIVLKSKKKSIFGLTFVIETNMLLGQVSCVMSETYAERHLCRQRLHIYTYLHARCCLCAACPNEHVAASDWTHCLSCILVKSCCPFFSTGNLGRCSICIIFAFFFLHVIMNFCHSHGKNVFSTAGTCQVMVTVRCSDTYLIGVCLLVLLGGKYSITLLFLKCISLT